MQVARPPACEVPAHDGPAALKQALRFAATRGETAADVDPAAEANALMSFVAGRWHQYAKSGFRRDPAEYWQQQWKQLTAGVIA